MLVAAWHTVRNSLWLFTLRRLAAPRHSSWPSLFSIVFCFSQRDFPRPHLFHRMPIILSCGIDSSSRCFHSVHLQCVAQNILGCEFFISSPYPPGDRHCSAPMGRFQRGCPLAPLPIVLEIWLFISPQAACFHNSGHSLGWFPRQGCHAEDGAFQQIFLALYGKRFSGVQATGRSRFRSGSRSSQSRCRSPRSSQFR